MKYALAFALSLLAGAASAQTYTTVPLGGGFYSTTGPSGTYTTVPLGGGFSTTTGPNGYNSTTIPLGGGFSTTTVNPGYQPQPLFQPYGYR
jgi:hypothetical protein